MLGQSHGFLWITDFPLAAFLGGLWEKVGLASDYKRVAIRAGGATVSDACCNRGVAVEQVDGATYPFFPGGIVSVIFIPAGFSLFNFGAAIGALIYGLVPED